MDADPTKRSKRSASYDCMARIITALAVCGKMDRSTIKEKSDVPTYSTVVRVLRALEKEGLVKVTKEGSRTNYYEWIDKS